MKEGGKNFVKFVLTLNFIASPFFKDLSELVDSEFMLFDSVASHEIIILLYFIVIDAGVCLLASKIFAQRKFLSK